jgi:hypothetical protein
MNRTAKEFEGLLAWYFETLLHDNPRFSTIYARLRNGEGCAVPAAEADVYRFDSRGEELK